MVPYAGVGVPLIVARPDGTTLPIILGPTLEALIRKEILPFYDHVSPFFQESGSSSLIYVLPALLRR